MMATLLRALGTSVPVGLVLCGAAILFVMWKTVAALLQLIGAVSLLVVGITHIY